jgi:hypothetical protein
MSGANPFIARARFAAAVNNVRLAATTFLYRRVIAATVAAGPIHAKGVL